MSSVRSAYAEAFWDSIRDKPALRGQLVELIEAPSWRSLAGLWGFEHHEQLTRYVRGPLRRRLEREAGGEALKFLMLLMGEKGI